MIHFKDLKKGQRLAKSIETGACSVNDMAMSYGVNEVPFGGVKESGYGNELSSYGILEFINIKTVYIR